MRRGRLRRFCRKPRGATSPSGSDWSRRSSSLSTASLNRTMRSCWPGWKRASVSGRAFLSRRRGLCPRGTQPEAQSAEVPEPSTAATIPIERPMCSIIFILIMNTIQLRKFRWTLSVCPTRSTSRSIAAKRYTLGLQSGFGARLETRQRITVSDITHCADQRSPWYLSMHHQEPLLASVCVHVMVNLKTEDKR
jgi:hypothetical protein